MGAASGSGEDRAAITRRQLIAASASAEDKAAIAPIAADGGGEDGAAITRRRLIAVGAVTGAGLVVGARPAFASTARIVRRIDFSTVHDRGGWPSGWACPGVANLRVTAGQGVLEAGSDVFPYDPRPAAFEVDARTVDGSVRAIVTKAGSLVGVMVRRTSTTPPSTTRKRTCCRSCGEVPTTSSRSRRYRCPA